MISSTMKITGFLTLGLLVLAANAFPQDVDQAKRALEAAIQSQDAAALKEAVNQLVTINNDKAVKALMTGHMPQDQDLYWLIISGLASVTSPSALDELKKIILKGDTLQDTRYIRDILYMLKNNRAYTVIPMLVGLLEKGSDRLKLAAVDHLQEFRGKEPVEPLLTALEKELKDKKKSELKNRIVIALETVTGQKLGDTISNWQAWWAKEKENKAAEPNLENLAGAGGGGSVLESLDPERKSAFEKLRNPDPTEKKPELKVVIVESDCKHGATVLNHDKDWIQQAVGSFGVQYTIIKKSQVAGYDFSNTMAVLINCNQFKRHCICPDCKPNMAVGPNDRLYPCVCSKNPPVHTPHENPFSAGAISKIASYVNNGGYLFTEDWVLEELLAKAFSAYVKDGTKVRTPQAAGEMEVTVMPEVGALSHPYMNRTFGERMKTPPSQVEKKEGQGGQTEFLPPPPVVLDKEKVVHKWKVDDESPVIQVQDKNKVTVLMVSPELGSKYNANPVAITFGTGGGRPDNNITGAEGDRIKMTGGRVLHVMSHFTKQNSETDGFALLNLLMNFLIEANERKLSKDKKK